MKDSIGKGGVNMNCPRCGTKMCIDSKLGFGDGKPPVVIYYCPKCGEMAHK